MDWEKQDNELRKLMEGSDFLPDTERWDANGVWTKLQHKKQPTHRKAFAIWVLLASAACVIGLLGVGLWWYQQGSPVINPITEVSENTVENERDANGSGPPALVQATPDEIPSGNNQINSEKDKASQDLVLKLEKHKTPENRDSDKLKDSLIFSKEEPVIVFNQEKGGKTIDSIVVSSMTVPVEEGLPSIVIVPAPARNTKPRVVHYNQLGGLKSTAPPVFVQTKKQSAEWEGFVMQTIPNRKESPFQLKIGIPPAPKKSL